MGYKQAGMSDWTGAVMLFLEVTSRRPLGFQRLEFLPQEKILLEMCVQT